SWRVVPLRFFRIQAQVILGVLVLGALAQARTSGLTPTVWLTVVAALLAYLATVTWGLGLPQVGHTAGILIALVTASWVVAASWSAQAGLGVFHFLGRWASGFLMGTTLTAMLLGHYYLIAPAMTIDPLKRTVTLIALGLAARCLLASIVLLVAPAARSGS